jgi:hypothetical protein
MWCAMPAFFARRCTIRVAAGGGAPACRPTDDVKGAVSAFDAEVLEVDRAGLGDPQPQQPEQADQRGVHRTRPAGGGDQGAELHPVQAEGLGVRRYPGSPDVVRRGLLEPTVDDQAPVEPDHRGQPPGDGGRGRGGGPPRAIGRRPRCAPWSRRTRPVAGWSTRSGRSSGPRRTPASCARCSGRGSPQRPGGNRRTGRTGQDA